MSEIASVYTDGGVIGRNPSTLGGTWAWCQVDTDGIRLLHASGTVTPSGVGMRQVTNNLTELLAAVLALEALPVGWRGTVFTDSLITLRRIDGGNRFNGIPSSIVDRLDRCCGRLGRYRVQLLGGHPSRKELAVGVRADGAMVSVHNVYCDALCAEQSRMFRERQKGGDK